MTTAVVTGARAPVALHLARLFAEAVHSVVLADSLHRPMARATRCKVGYERLPPPVAGLGAYADAWTRLLARWTPAIVIPTCEDVFHLAAVRDIAGVAIPLFAPSLETLTAVHDKSAFASLACGLGADPPWTQRLMSRTDVTALGADDLVFKPVWSRFGSRTLVKPDATRRATLVPTPDDPWVAQTYLPGEEICVSALATRGEVRACQAYRPLWRAGLGAGIAFAPLADAGVDAFVANFCAKLAWTGQVSFDFRRDADGSLHAIECNPRPTSGVHFFGPNDGLVEAMLGTGHAKASGTGGMTLPLAMATYGLVQALRAGTTRQWWADMCTMDDIAAWPGDGRLIGAQLLALAEVAWIALRRGKGLRAAATDDIEWNGKEFTRCTNKTV